MDLNIAQPTPNYVENAVPLGGLSVFQVSDVDRANLSSATVVISADFQTGDNVLWIDEVPSVISIDTIQNFNVADDTFWLSRLAGGSVAVAFSALPAGPLAAGAFLTGTAVRDPSDRIIYNELTGALLYDADGSGGAAAAVQLATLTGVVVGLTFADFVVV